MNARRLAALGVLLAALGLLVFTLFWITVGHPGAMAAGNAGRSLGLILVAALVLAWRLWR